MRARAYCGGGKDEVEEAVVLLRMNLTRESEILAEVRMDFESGEMDRILLSSPAVITVFSVVVRP